MNNKLKQLNKKIIKCRKCPRLNNFIKKISTEKRKQNINDTYWGKPVPGFGKTNSKLLILGLAPAAHGGTRTGRPFTGDKSSDFLFSWFPSFSFRGFKVTWVLSFFSFSVSEFQRLGDGGLAKTIPCFWKRMHPVSPNLDFMFPGRFCSQS